jgi:hypothetical protein
MISDDFIVYNATLVFIFWGGGWYKIIIAYVFMFSKSIGEWAEVFIWVLPSSNTGKDTGCLQRSLVVCPNFEVENKGSVS